MKILHVGEYVNGGVATYLKTLLNGLQQYKDIDNYLVMSKYKSEQDWGNMQNKVTYYEYKRSIFNIFKVMIFMYSFIKKMQPDIIHVHSTWAGVFVRLPLFFMRKKFKIIYQPHGWSFLMDTSQLKKKVYIFIEKILSITTDKIINISNYEQNKAIEYGFNKRKMVMIYNGVEDKKDTGSMKIVMDKNKINLLFVGRLDRQKGLDIFLKTYEKHEFPNIHLYVIGTSVLDNTVPKSTERTTYLGWIDSKDIDAYYQACDAVIVPSRWEGFGLVVVEAMRNSKPVIVSDVGALPELIQNNTNGYIFNLKEENSLKNILFKLDKKKLKIIGDNNRKIFLRKFIDKQFVENIYTLYKDLLVIKNENIGDNR